MATPKLLPVGKGKLGYTTSNTFKQPLKKVWEAVTQAKHLQKYFVDKMKGEFGPELKPVAWNWKKYGDMPITVTRYEEGKLVELLMPTMDGKYQTRVTFEFVRKGNISIFRIHDKGYKPTDLKLAFMTCEGWTEFHTCMKAYLKYGVDLRKA